MADPFTMLAVASFVQDKAIDMGIDAAIAAPWKAYRERRIREAREAICRRVAAGQRYAATEDDTLYMMLKICQAAVDGAAKENLDLLAQAIASGAHEPTLVAARFRQWNRILSELSREEILVLGRYIAGINSSPNDSDGSGGKAAAGHQQAVADLVGPGKPLKSAGEVTAHLFALQRTGLLLVGNGWNEIYPSPTALLTELSTFIDFDAAIAATEEVD